MIVLLIETYIVFGAALLATGTNLVRAWRGRTRRYHYAVTAVVAGYVTVIYALALLGILNIRDIGPDYLRIANILVMASLSGNAIAHWKSGGNGE